MPVTARGVFHTTTGAVSRNAPVTLEMFDVKRGAWVGVGKGKTDLRGRCTITADIGDEGFLPALRLHHALSGTILNGIRSTGGRAGDLTIDFGADERSGLERVLEQQKAKLAASLAAQKVLDDRLEERVKEVDTVSVERDALAKRLQAVETDSAQQTRFLAKTKAALTEATAERDRVTAKLSTTDSELADRRRELLKSTAARDRLTSKLGTAETKLAGQLRDLSETKSALKATTSDRNSLRGQLAKSVSAHDALQVELGAAVAERDGLTTKLGTTSREADGLRIELGKAVATRDGLTVKLGTTEAELADRGDELLISTAALKAARSDRDAVQFKLDKVTRDKVVVKDRLTQGDKLRGELLTELLDLRKRVRGSEIVHQPIGRVVGDLGAEIDRAYTQIGEAGIGFELASVNVKLHGLLDTDGTSISLDDHDAIASGGSQVEFRFRHAGLDDADPDDVSVPSVLGLTLVAARRLLQAHRLSIVTSTSTLSETDTALNGQAKLQSPAAGTSVVPGTEVHVIIASSADPFGT